MMSKHKYLAVMIMLLCMCKGVIVAQTLQTAEYFFDQDPGIGNGFALNGLNPTNGAVMDSVELNTSIVLPTTLTVGPHRIYVRVAKGNQWSVYQGARFIVSPSTGNAISLMEYFIDQDPGVGNGIILSSTMNLDSAMYNGVITTQNLSTGYHHLCIRAQDMQGKWAINQTRRFHINHSNSNSSIDKIEYFYDQDPGMGFGNDLTINGTIDSSSYSGIFSTAGLTTGRHQLYVRTRTNDGIWSAYEPKQIHVVEGSNLLTQAEYFFDQDPGLGNGQGLTLIPSNLEAEYVGNISSFGLTPGRHQLFIRAKTVNGVWGLYDSKKIEVYDNPLNGEYFFDTDPGIGNASTFSMNNISTGQAEFSGSLLSSNNLFHGSHRIFIRSRSASEKWSTTDSAAIFINCSNPVVGQVIQTPGVGACGDDGVLLSLQNSFLNEGTQWSWYSGICGGNQVGTGPTLFVTPEDTTTYFVRGEGGCTNTFVCTQIPVNFNPSSHLKIKLFLEGYYIGFGMMTTALFNEGQPTCSDITDTLTVELHDPNDFSLVNSKKVILHTDGISRCDFTPFSGSFYIAIKHRNGIETWSSNPIHLGNELTGYDFSNSLSKAYADNMKEVDNGIFAFYSGDINNDGAVDAFDYLLLDPDVFNGESGYISTDLNGDGSVDAFDYLILSPNVYYGIGSFHP